MNANLDPIPPHLPLPTKSTELSELKLELQIQILETDPRLEEFKDDQMNVFVGRDKNCYAIYNSAYRKWDYSSAKLKYFHGRVMNFQGTLRGEVRGNVVYSKGKYFYSSAEQILVEDAWNNIKKARPLSKYAILRHRVKNRFGLWNHLKLSWNKKILAINDEKELRLMNTKTNKLLNKLEMEFSGYSAFTFLSDSKIIYVCNQPYEGVRFQCIFYHIAVYDLAECKIICKTVLPFRLASKYQYVKKIDYHPRTKLIIIHILNENPLLFGGIIFFRYDRKQKEFKYLGQEDKCQSGGEGIVNLGEFMPFTIKDLPGSLFWYPGAKREIVGGAAVFSEWTMFLFHDDGEEIKRVEIDKKEKMTLENSISTKFGMTWISKGKKFIGLTKDRKLIQMDIELKEE